MQENVKDLKFVIRDKTHAEVRFQDQSIAWNIFMFNKSSKLLTEGIFEQINQFIHLYVSVEDQAKIFEVYKELRANLDLPSDDVDLKLKSLVHKLYQYFDNDKLEVFVKTHARVTIPPELEVQYIETIENTGNRDRTYIRSDYQQLLALAVGLRPMVPIWGDYLHQFYKEKGTANKEYFAGELLAGSRLDSSPGMIKFKLFVFENIPKNVDVGSAILSAYSREEFPVYLERMALVRRLAIGDIAGTGPESHLVKYIHQYIRNKIENHESTFDGRIKPKVTPDSSSSDESNNISKAEGYKIREEVDRGQRVILEMSIADTKYIANKLCPSIPMSMVEESLECIRKNQTSPLERCQKALIQYVYKPVFSPRGIMGLERAKIINLLGVTQAILWHKGHFELAALVGATKIDGQDDFAVGSFDRKSKLTKEQVEELNRLFPFTRQASGKQRVVKNENVAIDAIERLANDFSSHDWSINIPSHWIKPEHGFVRPSRHFCSPNIRPLLGELAILVAKHQYPFAV